VLFRLGALALGVVVLLVVEVALRIFGWGDPLRSDDPFVGFGSVHPLFILDEPADRYRIAPSRLVFFREDSFAARKDPSGFRIFCLGGSTVQGRPFEPSTSFTTWLRLGLEAADGKTMWEVINCGGISYASYRLVPILEEVLQYDPDLIVLYTGHNEFLEERTYGSVKYRHPLVLSALESAARLRTLVLLRRAYRSIRGDACDEERESPTADRSLLPDEVDTLLDRSDGFDAYHRDEAFFRGVIAHFAHNLERMIRLAADAGVPLVLVNPVSNLRDCPPFKSQHRDGLSAEELSKFETLWKRATLEARESKPLALERMRHALLIDDEYAAIHWEMGKYQDDLGLGVEARESYLRAKELDVCPLRAPEAIHEVLLEARGAEGISFVDARRVIEDLSRDGIPGNDWLIDHVHPTFLGHQKIAEAVMMDLVRRGVVRPGSDWSTQRDRRFAEHLASLPEVYFTKGMARLERLRIWARRRAQDPGSR